MGICKADDGCDYVENDSAFRKFMSQIFRHFYEESIRDLMIGQGFSIQAQCSLTGKPSAWLYRDIHLVILSGKVQTLTPGSRCFIKE